MSKKLAGTWELTSPLAKNSSQSIFSCAAVEAGKSSHGEMLVWLYTA
jgi:hypothetical protein